MGHFILSHSANLYNDTIQALNEIDANRSARWLSLIEAGFGVILSADRDERHRQLEAFELADIARITEAAAEQTVIELGDWETEETELKLLAYVERHGLC
jgi:hypothetical protein